MPGPQQTPQQATQPPAQVTSVSTSNASTVVGSSSATANQPSVGSAPANTSGETQQQMNTLSLCKVGAETVQDIVSRTIELFSFLKQLQLPNGTPNGTQACAEARTHIQENINRTRHLFKRLQIIYSKVNEECGGIDYTPIESLIPYRDEVETKPDLKKKSDAYRHYAEEVAELKEQVCLRSRYQKDIIDQLRKIIWEVNTMLAVRATAS